jgi:enoyl-CoA hydratase/carnithine racemase
MAVTFESDGRIGYLTLDRPPANSYDLNEMRQFSSAVDQAADEDVRAVIVRSSSPKFFSAGADAKRFLEGDVDESVEMVNVSHAAFARMEAAAQVFIAHIAGHALGGGLEIALACDLRLASDGDYKLGTPEVNLGLLPGNGGTQRLPRLVGRGCGMELLLTGRTLSPREALDIGLVSELLPAAESEQRVTELAERLARGPRLAIASIKRSVIEGSELTLEDGLALERELIAELFRSEDAREGLTAFVEKRRPAFSGA